MAKKRYEFVGGDVTITEAVVTMIVQSGNGTRWTMSKEAFHAVFKEVEQNEVETE